MTPVKLLHDDVCVMLNNPSATNNNTRNKKKKAYPKNIRQMLSRKSIYWKRWRSTKDPGHQQAYKAYSVKCSKAIKAYYRDLETALVQSDN